MLGDFLLSYPEERSFDVQGESELLQSRAKSNDEVMLLAIVDNKIVATAGISAVGHKYKVKHRAEFGIDVAKAYWAFGIGKALMKACVECARSADTSNWNSTLLRIMKEQFLCTKV